MKKGQRVKQINGNLSHYGEYGMVTKGRVMTAFGVMIEVKFDDKLTGLFRKGSLIIQKVKE